MRTLLAAAAVAAVTVTGASAASITIDSVTGVWGNIDPASGISGGGTNEIRWGIPLAGQQSGYRFDGEAPPAYVVFSDVVFDLGTFTHFNWPISSSSTVLNSADLTVSVAIDGIGTINSVFTFEHLETPNGANPCANGEAYGSGVNVNGCADRVVASLNLGASDTFVIDGVEYVFDISGFFYSGSLLDEFWTVESATNQATLKGVFTAVIPLPAGLPLLLGGLVVLGGLGATRRRKAIAA